MPAQLVTHYLITHCLSKETPVRHAFDPELAPIEAVTVIQRGLQIEQELS